VPSISQRLALTAAWFRLGRPLFLAGGFVMHALGASIALYPGVPLSLPALLLGQLTVTAAQLMTHYANDYYDLPADQANQTPTYWSGGSRVLPAGALSPRVALGTALALAGLALAGALVLALAVQPAPLTLPLLLLAMALAWEYSAPPFRLHANGLGTLTGSVVVTLLTPLVGYYLQACRLSALPLLACLPLACLQFAMLISVDLPDLEGDAAGGKRTLVVRLGRRRAGRLQLVAIALAYVLLLLLKQAGLPGAVAGTMAAGLPLGLWQIARLLGGASTRRTAWPALIFGGISLLMITGALALCAFLWLSFVR
jgi:1,4-dihydroxy-2-naphthoate octaprenyltransferase